MTNKMDLKKAWVKVDEIMKKHGYSREKACGEYCDKHCIHNKDGKCNPYSCLIYEVYAGDDI